MTLDRLIAAYLKQRAKEGVSASTLDLATRWLGCFRGFCQKHRLEAAMWLTPRHLEEFETQLLWQPNSRGRFYSPNSVDQALRMVRSCLRWAIGQHLADQSATRLVEAEGLRQFRRDFRHHLAHQPAAQVEHRRGLGVGDSVRLADIPGAN